MLKGRMRERRGGCEGPSGGCEDEVADAETVRAIAVTGRASLKAWRSCPEPVGLSHREDSARAVFAEATPGRGRLRCSYAGVAVLPVVAPGFPSSLRYAGINCRGKWPGSTAGPRTPQPLFGDWEWGAVVIRGLRAACCRFGNRSLLRVNVRRSRLRPLRRQQAARSPRPGPASPHGYAGTSPAMLQGDESGFPGDAVGRGVFGDFLLAPSGTGVLLRPEARPREYRIPQGIGGLKDIASFFFFWVCTLLP